MTHYIVDADDKYSDLDLDYDWEQNGGRNDTDEPDVFFTESLAGDSILWHKRSDGDIYVETRGGNWSVMIIPKDEAIALMAWLSENTK